MNYTLAKTATALAMQQLGKREATGHNDGAFVNMLQRWVAGGARWLDRQPWCACFVTYYVAAAAKQAGVKTILPRTASVPALWTFAQKHNLVLAHPVENCIGILFEGGRPAHTFFVLSPGQHTVDGVDGNWSNAVCRTNHPIYSCRFVAIA